MTAGRLVFLDSTRQALLFPSDASDAARRYGVVTDPASLDFATYDFAVEFAALWDTTMDATAGQYKTIVQKCPDYAGQTVTYLDGAAGWAISLNRENQRIRVSWNDGNATAVSFSWDTVWPADLTTFFRIEFDRDVGATLYVNGVKNATVKTEITGRTGSVSNANNLIIGGQPGVNLSYLKGSMSLLRFDNGYSNLMAADGSITTYNYSVSYGEVWNYETYLKSRHYWPQILGHYQAAWYFANSLVDLSANALTIAFKDGTGAGATATYDDVWPTSDAYAFTYDPQPSGHSFAPIDLDSRQRGLDGTMRIYKGAKKESKSWKFTTTDVEQIIALKGAYYTASPLHVYDISLQPFTWRGYLTAFEATEVFRRGDPTDIDNFNRFWEVTVELEEM